jgi:dCMP deaminase
MIIGLTGSLAAGKGYVAKILQEMGYEYHSLSDIIRDECKSRGLQNEREIMIKIGNELRENEGSGVLAKRILKKISKDKNTIVDSIRNPEEVNELRKDPNFILIAVDASKGVRFQRILARKREGDPKTLKEFEKIDKIDKGQGEKSSGQQVGKCLKMADAILVNEGDDTKEKVKKIIRDFNAKLIMKNRPSWDKYFMDIAKLTGKRSTCLRRTVGAVLVKNKEIISTGYNGAPKGMSHCYDLGGCLREKLQVPSGQRAEICRAVHAEQNCITQAAFFGVPVDGATLYSTTYPCVICAKLLINAGIKEIVLGGIDYDDELSKKMLQESGIKIRKIDV